MHLKNIPFSALKETFDMFQEASNHLSALGIRLVGYKCKVIEGDHLSFSRAFHRFQVIYDEKRYPDISSVFSNIYNEFSDQDITIGFEELIPGTFILSIGADL